MFRQLGRVRPVLLAMVLFTSCGGGVTGTDSPVLYDPCQPLAVIVEADITPDQMMSVASAIALWNSRAASRLVLAGGDGVAPGMAQLPLFFQQAAAPFHGFYDDRAGFIFINRKLADDHERAVTVAHELGHAFGLVHVAANGRPSVMTVANLVTEPTLSDVDDLAARWGRCAP